MFNTPPVLPVFAALQTLRWLKDQGGVDAMYQKNIEKAQLLYLEIERNKLFKVTVSDVADQSFMNVCWVMNENYTEYEKEFLDFATGRGMIGIKGHRSVGGFRASTYNALPRESVEALITVMQEFESEKA